MFLLLCTGMRLQTPGSSVYSMPHSTLNPLNHVPHIFSSPSFRVSLAKLARRDWLVLLV